MWRFLEGLFVVKRSTDANGVEVIALTTHIKIVTAISALALSAIGSFGGYSLGRSGTHAMELRLVRIESSVDGLEKQLRFTNDRLGRLIDVWQDVDGRVNNLEEGRAVPSTRRSDSSRHRVEGEVGAQIVPPDRDDP